MKITIEVNTQEEFEALQQCLTHYRLPEAPPSKPEAAPHPAAVVSERLSNLLLPEQYRASRAEMFPSPLSLQWQVRTNRSALVEAGALVTIAGRHRIDPERADAVFLSLGKPKAPPKGANGPA